MGLDDGTTVKLELWDTAGQGEAPGPSSLFLDMPGTTARILQNCFFNVFPVAERYRSIAPMYYRNAVAAAVVFNITDPETYAGAKRWV